MGNLIGSAFNYVTQWEEVFYDIYLNCINHMHQYTSKLLHDASELQNVLKDSIVTKIATQNISISFFGSHSIIILTLINKNNAEYKIGILPDYVHALRITQFPLLSTHTYDIHISSPISIKYNKKTEYMFMLASNQKQNIFNNFSIIRTTENDTFNNYYGLTFDSNIQQSNCIKLSSTETNSKLKTTLTQTQLFSNDIINIICSYAFHEIEHIIIHSPKFNWKIHRTANIAVLSSIRNMAGHTELSMKYIDFRTINNYVHDGQLNLTLHKNIKLIVHTQRVRYSDLNINNLISATKIEYKELDLIIYCVHQSFSDCKMAFPQLFMRMNELIH
eukprot:102865_1